MTTTYTRNINWTVDKLAELMRQLKQERDDVRRIGYGRGWVAELNGEYAGYVVEVVCSYRSAMGINLTRLGANHNTLIVTDVNHIMTPTTVQHIHRYMRDMGDGNCYKLYETRSARIEAFNGTDYPARERTVRKAFKADAEHGYVNFLNQFADVFNALNE